MTIRPNRVVSGPRPRRLAARTAVTLLTAVAGLAGCGGAGDGGDRADGAGDVASLTAPADSASASAPAGGTGGGPQLRLDTTEAEKSRLWQSYLRCLKDHGVPENHGQVPGAAGNGDGIDLDLSSGEPKAAYAACADKLPVMPPELDPKKNPNYLSQFSDYVQCLRGRGMKIHALPDGSGWTYDDGVAIAVEGEALTRAERDCTQEAFGGRK
ncbi:hypothetical protein ACIBTV_10225 [Micromonospora sp. NPDC049366]|uniref:hypothetical protein n=1 Tax=Micromonospora sp. NPDC049366 TaxID=3364271 RepID=UPI0037AAA299